MTRFVRDGNGSNKVSNRKEMDKETSRSESLRGEVEVMKRKLIYQASKGLMNVRSNPMPVTRQNDKLLMPKRMGYCYPDSTAEVCKTFL